MCSYFTFTPPTPSCDDTTGAWWAVSCCVWELGALSGQADNIDVWSLLSRMSQTNQGDVMSEGCIVKPWIKHHICYIILLMT
jgi:hypothetical protein